MRILKHAFVFSFLILLTAGCAPFVEDNRVEEIAPVIFWSFNEGSDGRIKMSTLVPPASKEKKTLFTSEVELLKQGQNKFNYKYHHEVKLGQLRMLFINEKLAKTQVKSLINTIISDPDVSPRLYLIIVKGDFEEYLKSQSKKDKDLDYDLYQMFKHYERKNQGEMTIVNLHEFMERLHSPYTDGVLPVFKADKDNFSYEGTSFFSNSVQRGTTKKMEDQMFQLLANDHYLRNLTVPSLSLSLGRVRSTVHTVLNEDNSSLNIDVHIRARIDEYRGRHNLVESKEFMKMDHELESYLTQHSTELIRKMQRLKVDPLGIATHTVHPFKHPMSREEWMNRWEKVKINVDYHLSLEPFSI